MPTVMVYVSLFTTFMLWITYDSMQYSQLAISFEQQFYVEKAFKDVEDTIKKSLAENDLNECFPQKLNFKNIHTNEYDIKINGYCIRSPNTLENIPPVSASARALNQVFLTGNNELTKLEYQQKRLALTSTYTFQITNDLIGLPVDWEILYGPEYALIDAADYPLILKMDRLFIYDATIKSKNKVMDYMYIYNLDKNVVEQVYVTNY